MSAGAWLLLLGVIAAAALAIAPSRRRAAGAIMVIALWGATARLGVALWQLDLSFTYVAEHARRGTGGWYRLAGLWGGSSGSLLFFVALLAIAVLVAAPAGPRVLRIGAATVAALGVALLAFANPFARLQIPAIDGGGLQPILEHPAMIYHPPILYAGLAATYVVWAQAVGTATDERRRRWIAATFAVLTLGQAFGANWAYVELGWGGYWGWDPVENGVLIAWLMLVAGLHAGPLPPRWRRLVIAGVWPAVLLTAFVTRAGVGTSVHAFADDGRIGRAISAILVATLLVTVAMIWRTDDAPTALDRRDPRALAAGLAVIAALIVTEGVITPLLLPHDPLVGGWFYARTLAPIAIIGVGASGLATVRPLDRRRTLALGVTAVAGAGIGGLVGARTAFALCVAAAGAIALASLVSNGRGRAPVWLAHAGFAVLMVGVAGSTQTSRTMVMLGPGERATVGGATFEHLAIETVSDGRVDRVVATLMAEAGGRRVELRPSLDRHLDQNRLLAETATWSGITRDVQATLQTAADDGSAGYELQVRPLVSLVWCGALMIAAAGAWRAGRRRRGGDGRPPRAVLRTPTSCGPDADARATHRSWPTPPRPPPARSPP